MLRNDKELVSIIMPVFNAEKFIESSVNSVINQTYRNIELIIVDDGSSDSTCDVISRRFFNDSRVCLVRQENTGIVGALNKALEYCNGKYIARMDADDICFPWRISSQKEVLKRCGLDALGTSIVLMNESGIPFGYKFYDYGYNKNNTRLLFNSAVAHPSLFANRDVLFPGAYKAVDGSAEDLGLLTRAALEGKRISNIRRPGILYRKSEGQITNKKRDLIERDRLRITCDYSDKAKFPMRGDVFYTLSSRHNFGELDEHILLDELCSLMSNESASRLWDFNIVRYYAFVHFYYAVSDGLSRAFIKENRKAIKFVLGIYYYALLLQIARS